MGSRRAVVFCGRSLAQANPGLETVRTSLGDLFAGAFTAVAEHSPLLVVEAAADTLRRLEADAVVVLGGGSAIVTARAATILLGEGKSAHELCTVFEPGRPPVSPKLNQPKLPQFVIPTTPTTAYAKAGAAVSLPDEGRRLSMFDPKARAQAIFFPPKLFMSAPAKLARDASLDAFGLAIQGLESLLREPLADALLLHGVRLIRRHLQRLIDAPQDTDVRGQLMLAALLVGQGTDFTSAGLASAIGHSIGARFSVANGLASAVVLPHTLRFNAPATEGRLEDVAGALGAVGSASGVAQELSRACSDFFAQLGLPSQLRDLGVGREDLPRIAEVTAGDWFYAQNPRRVGSSELTELLAAAW